MRARSPSPTVVAITTAAIAVTLVAGLARALTHDPAPATGAPTPEGALRAYDRALAAGDCRRAARSVDPSFLGEEALCERFEETVAASGRLVRVVDRDIGEERATLIVERDVGPFTDRRIVRAVRRDDGWRLAGGSSCFPVQHPTDLGTAHLPEGESFDDYSSRPPTSGPHSPMPTRAGAVYDEAQPLPEVVHAMEHGAVVFWVDANAPAPMRETLTAHARRLFHRGYHALVVTPLSGLQEAFAMTAWGSLQRCLGVSEAEIDAFVGRFYGSGGEGAIACGGPAARLPPCRSDRGA